MARKSIPNVVVWQKELLMLWLGKRIAIVMYGERSRLMLIPIVKWPNVNSHSKTISKQQMARKQRLLLFCMGKWSPILIPIVKPPNVNSDSEAA
jgi:hypothetical protein